MTAWELDATHDPERRSWLATANAIGADFPLQNLPFGIFEEAGRRRGGVAIGDQVLDLEVAITEGLFSGLAQEAAQAASRPSLNAFMAMGHAAAACLRSRLADVFDERASRSTRDRARLALLSQSAVSMSLPCDIGDYTDFLTSIHHTERHGRYKGLANPIPDAFKHLPVAYHGRASSIRASGTPVQRPWGQWREPGGEVVYAPAASLDFELEFGVLIGKGNEQGTPIPVEAARDAMFGFCLVNDWSAKGIQWWEQVLGPFLGKSFLTSISPWVVTLEALLPFAKPATKRSPQDPEPLHHLRAGEVLRDGYAIDLQVTLQTHAMRQACEAGPTISSTNLDCMYWSFSQMVAHHTSNGCNLRTGDLLASGTLSGESGGSMGCLTEMAQAGKKPVTLANGEARAWLQDGDLIEIRAQASGDGFVPIGFGSCSGLVVAAR